jgi:subtilisin family serine protease
MKRIVSVVLIAWLLPASVASKAQVGVPASAAQASAAQASLERVYIAFQTGGKSPVIAAVHAAGGTIHHEFDALSAIAATLPSAAVTALRNNPNVAYIEADPIRQPLSQTVPYGIDKVQARDIWDANRDGVIDSGAPTGSNRIVCIIDSGFSSGHDDLAGVTASGTNNSGTGNWFEDTCGHGTHVAGTVVASHNNLGVVGVTPGAARVHVVKVFDGSSCGWAYSSTLVNAANACASAGANIISMSLGGTFSSTTESNAFANLYNSGILSVAAAGNAGNTRTSYPAGYASVISVAAVDQNNAAASFSQRNSDVELAAPGVGVLSTVPWSTPTVSVDGASYQAGLIEGAAQAAVSGALVNGGLCTSVGSWSGNVVLCERGTNSFAQKVSNVQAGGGAAAIIYNNVAGDFAGTLNGSSAIPAVSLSQQSGQFLVANKLGFQAAVDSRTTSPGSGYEAWDGTSMATPHVSAVAALIWSANTGWTNAQIRTALQQTALDLGSAGRDSTYGYGLVQAKSALDYLQGGSPTPNAPPNASFTYSCSGLTCAFTSTSSDSDGTIVGHAWNFGDGTSSTAQNPSKTYSAAGTFSVMLSVTDNDSASSSATQSVTVSGATGISLSATGYKVKGSQKADLTWSGASGTAVDVYRDDVKIITTDNDGAHTDHINNKGGGSYSYRVCTAGTMTCSNTVTVTF